MIFLLDLFTDSVEQSLSNNTCTATLYYEEIMHFLLVDISAYKQGTHYEAIFYLYKTENKGHIRCQRHVKSLFTYVYSFNEM